MRIAWACGAGALVFTIVSSRLVDLHVGKHEEYSRIAAEKNTVRQVIPAKRGLILDRNGDKLAVNLPVHTVFADASHIKDAEQVSDLVARFLELKREEVAQKIATGGKYLVLKRKVPDATVLKLQAEMRDRNLRGVYTEVDSIRSYPNGPMLGHVLGYLNHERKGVQGIERTMEKALAGEDGFRFTERDRTGREIVLYRGQEQEPQHGKNIRLTIDMGLQAILEEEIDATYRDLKPNTVNAIMVDPKTGEILAMASRPCFDPNTPGKSDPETMKNRSIIDMVEPGSTFKIVVAAGALNEGKVDETSSIFCENGRYFYGGRTLKDHHGYGHMSVHEILVKSSNIGCAKMAMMMGGEKFHEYVKRFGFGDRLGIELPGEIPGLVHPPSRWDKLTITRMPMGHSVAVTPLQITMGMSVIANGGKLMAPQIVKSVEDQAGGIDRHQPKVVREVVPEKTAHFISNALAAVTQPGGTATFARVNGFNVAGKTGTAQKVSDKGGYAPGKYVVSFVGYMPAEDPRFVCLVMVDDAQVSSGLNYGGLVAAPIFSRIAERSARHLDLVPTEPAIALQPDPVTASLDAQEATR
ncbi:MAG: peptidoglycan D,D-transpeptidase FtsI family protein [Terrimicrobiaceae bacterium]